MKNIKGYTLVEVAIVMLIISIMSIIVKGTYDGTVEKSKWSEPYTVVNKIIDAQKQFHVLNDKFANDFNELNIDIDGDKEQRNGEDIGSNITNGKETGAIITNYFRYDTNSSDDNSICKIIAARIFKDNDKGLIKTKAEVTFILSYFEKDEEGHPGNTFYLTKEPDIAINGDFPSKPALREIEKFSKFFANKSY